MKPFLYRRNRRLTFVFAPEHRNAGSTVMRGEQLSALTRSALTDRSVDFRPADPNFASRDLFLTKGVLKVADDRLLQRWRSRGNRLFIDPVDEVVPASALQSADVIVAASRTAEADYRERWPDREIAIVDHHVDPRVRWVHNASAHPVVPRIGYFGEDVNAYRDHDVESRVDFVPIDTTSRDATWLHRIPHYSAHYAVRLARELDAHKPFLKGFTAAACAAPVVIQDSQGEARRWLPDDYPYWVRGEVASTTVVSTLEMVRDTYGAAEWVQALETMREIAHRVSDGEIARQVADLVSL